MKLFYVVAVCLTLLCGLAAKAILQPIQPVRAAIVTIVDVKKNDSTTTALSWVSAKMENRCCTKCI